MKDHDVAKLVSDLTAVAKNGCYSQQLRSLIAEHVIPGLEAAWKAGFNAGMVASHEAIESIDNKEHRPNWMR